MKLDKKEIKTSFMSIRLPAEVANAIRKTSVRDTRTIAAQVLHYVKIGLESESK